MPSAPFFQPASSSSFDALSMLNSQDVFLETNCSGLLTKLAVVRPVRP